MNVITNTSDLCCVMTFIVTISLYRHISLTTLREKSNVIVCVEKKKFVKYFYFCRPVFAGI